MERAARNAGFAVRLREPQTNACEGACREPVLRFLKQRISQGKVSVAFLGPPWALGPQFRAQPTDSWKTASLSSAVLNDNRCAHVALQLAKRLPNRETSVGLSAVL